MSSRSSTYNGTRTTPVYYNGDYTLYTGSPGQTALTHTRTYNAGSNVLPSRDPVAVNSTKWTGFSESDVRTFTLGDAPGSNTWSFDSEGLDIVLSGLLFPGNAFVSSLMNVPQQITNTWSDMTDTAKRTNATLWTADDGIIHNLIVKFGGNNVSMSGTVGTINDRNDSDFTIDTGTTIVTETTGVVDTLAMTHGLFKVGAHTLTNANQIKFRGRVEHAYSTAAVGNSPDIKDQPDIFKLIIATTGTDSRFYTFGDNMRDGLEIVRGGTGTGTVYVSNPPANAVIG